MDDVPCLAVEGLPARPEVVEQLGVLRVVWHVDPDACMSRRHDYWDNNRNSLKTVRNAALQRFDAALSADLFSHQRRVRGL